MAVTKSPGAGRSSPGQATGGDSFVDRAWALQNRIENRLSRVGKGKYGRVLRMARKPTTDEFNRTAKITALGLLFLGLIGFIILLLMRPIPGVSP